MEPWILLLGIVVVGAVILALRRRPAAPPAKPKASEDASDAEPEIRAMLALREQLATEGLDSEIRGEVDELFARVARVGAEAMTAPSTNRASLRSMRELLQGTMRNGWNLSSARTTRVGFEELALMIERGEGRAPGRLAEEWADWAANLPNLPDLKVKGTPTEELLLTLQPGDWLLVAGQLCTVSGSGLGRYEETYQGQRWIWHEVPLTRFRDGEAFGIDWEVDDGIEISLTEAEYTLPEMNLTPTRVRELIEEEEGSVTFGGHRFEVNEGGTAILHRNGAQDEFDYVELTGPGGRTLTLEDWGDELSGFVSRDIPLRDVQLLEPR